MLTSCRIWRFSVMHGDESVKDRTSESGPPTYQNQKAGQPILPASYLRISTAAKSLSTGLPASSIKFGNSCRWYCSRSLMS